jgi:hypothetical protein
VKSSNNFGDAFKVANYIPAFFYLSVSTRQTISLFQQKQPPIFEDKEREENDILMRKT